MLKNYIKIAFLVLKRRKFFTFISLFAISFTLVVLIVVSSIFDHVLAPMAPEINKDRSLTMFFAEIKGKDSIWNGNPGYKLLNDYARNLPGVELMSIHSESSPAISYVRGQKIVSALKHTDGEYWKILQFKFLAGSPITTEDEKNANFVAVINQNTQEKFFPGQSAVGQQIEVDDQKFQVVGVVENVSQLHNSAYADIWVPLSTSKNAAYKTELMGSCIATLLAKSRADFPAIKAEIAARMKTVEFPTELKKEYEQISCFADTALEVLSREAFNSVEANPNPSRFIGILLGLMTLFMLLPAINLININVSRILERASEVGVRKAFGASSRTLVAQFITENLILTSLGGLLGFVGSMLTLQLINHSSIIQYGSFQVNYRVFFYGIIITVFFSLFSGVYPAWRMSKLNPVEALKGGSLR
ncbi:MAG: ABC transporter permease [Acidobacteria bacterium]|nr:ABC transporter permease [Acidobacteriota bacterium]